MKKILVSLLMNLVLMGGITVSHAMALDAPPDIKVSLVLDSATYSLKPDPIIDPIKLAITLENLSGGDIITSDGFSEEDFHLLLTFIGPDGEGIAANELGANVTENPPPQVIVVDGALEQVEPVEVLGASFILSVTLPDAHTFYALTRAGKYSVKAVIPMRTYSAVFKTVAGVDYAQIGSSGWADALESNTANFTLVDDADADGYWYPIDVSGLPDCDDADPNVNPGIVEIPGNGKDDDCNPATLDVLGSFSKFDIAKALMALDQGATGDSFSVRGDFALNPGSDGIDVLGEGVDVAFGDLTWTISGISFFRDEDNVGFQFNGPSGGITQINIRDDGGFRVRARGLNLIGIVLGDPDNATPFSLQIGNDGGETAIPFDNKGKFQQKKNKK